MESSWWADPSQLDNDQKKVVALATSKDHVVVGPPGCGKTNLLLLRATYLHKKSVFNIIILSFGRVLREFLATGTMRYPFAADKIKTYVRWGSELARANGIDFEEGADFEETRDRLRVALTEVASKERSENVHDVILLDEAQDYSADEISLIRRFSDRIFAVGDKNQQISKQRGGLEKLEKLGATRTTLTSHYRNGLKICRVADGVKNLIDDPKGMEATCNYIEAAFPSTVDVFGGLTISEKVATALPRIQNQLLAYPGELIGVLCPRIKDLDAVNDTLRASALGGEIHVQRAGAYSSFSSDRLVVVSTTMGAKGLEFRAAHIMAADKLKRFPTQINLTYTAVTRTKTSLSVYHEAPLAGYFEKGLGACHTVMPGEPSLDELFL